MSGLLKAVATLAGLMAFYLAITFFIELFHPACTQETVLVLNPPFPAYGRGGAAYSVTAPSLEQFSDSSLDPTRSPYQVCENGLLLGPAHSIHAHVIKKGRGRFSHWTETGFVFSAFDNSDPNTNGKQYRIVSRP